MSIAFPLPCSLIFPPIARLRPRHSYESKLATPPSGAPSVAVIGATSSRIQFATASAIVQRRVAGGVMATRTFSFVMTAESRTGSSIPQPFAPVILGNGSTVAISAVSLYDAAERRLLPGSPVVIETTYGYGKLWAEVLGVPLNPEFVDRID